MRLAARAALCANAAVILAGGAAGMAAAVPSEYAGYRAVDPEPFDNYSTYGGGVQFSSPNGQLCRIVIISRGGYAYAECFGDLHGDAEGNNLVQISTNGVAQGVSKTTRAQFLTFDQGGANTTPMPVRESDFVSLPAGSSLTYADPGWSGTCAVDADKTQCTIKPLSGSRGARRSFALTPTKTFTR
ncbi:hypothetical protein [Mycobacterium intracellulare]|uniref:Secreted protein n=1 Tax=Mycobacterium intracellulare subsp. chimaera TaxID=222805 RepID=A0ABT7P379_MYCIT|nr:hypothetical protein [Mycobacterium intracellulare]MDM3927739.1 hypothetical protein [Mycobacterium intracellulare subsp. chimaera]